MLKRRHPAGARAHSHDEEDQQDRQEAENQIVIDFEVYDQRPNERISCERRRLLKIRPGLQKIATASISAPTLAS
jgi:hypothetical protein